MYMMVRHVPVGRTHLTADAIYRQPDRMSQELLLAGRAHVDPAGTASARCPGC
jgi:hypothetical protein